MCWNDMPVDLQEAVYKRLDTRSRSSVRVAVVKPLGFPTQAADEERASESLYMIRQRLKKPDYSDWSIATRVGERAVADLAGELTGELRNAYQFVDDLENGTLNALHDYGDPGFWDADTVRRVCAHLVSIKAPELESFVRLNANGILQSSFLKTHMFVFCQQLRRQRDHRGRVMRHLAEYDGADDAFAEVAEAFRAQAPTINFQL
jgi:hypothetical protein